jgi:protein phosphatase
MNWQLQKSSRLRSFGNSEIGLMREQNEDSFICREDLGLFAVADGLGGLPDGALASQRTLQSLENRFSSIHLLNEEILRSTLIAINDSIYTLGKNRHPLTGIGSTLTALAISEQSLWIAHVGDSVLYESNDGNFTQLTKDQTLANYYRASPEIDQPELLPEYYEHTLMQCIGMEHSLDPFICEIPLNKKSRFLLCTDGISRLMKTDELHRFTELAVSPKELVDSLIMMGYERGAPDNLTAIAVFM